MHIDVGIAALHGIHHIGHSRPTTSIVCVWLGNSTVPDGRTQPQSDPNRSVLPKLNIRIFVVPLLGKQLTETKVKIPLQNCVYKGNKSS